MKSILLLAAVAIAFVPRVRAEEDQEENTILERFFHDDDEAYQKGIDRLFGRFDRNNDGRISDDDVTTFFDQADEKFATERQEASKAVRERIMEFDENKDGQVTREEFQAGLADYANSTFQIDRSLCHKAKQVTKACKDSFKANTNLNALFRVKLRVVQSACWAGLSGLNQYRTELCALSAPDCDAVAQCYAKKPSDEVPVPGVSEAPEGPELEKRDVSPYQQPKGQNVNTWKVLFWTSMIVLGIASLLTVVTFPFYVVVLIVAARAVNFNQVQPYN